MRKTSSFYSEKNAVVFALLIMFSAHAVAIAEEQSATQRSSPTPPVISRVEKRADITRLFLRESGWTGADGAYSIPLGKQRSLWLFGDTFIGSIQNGARVRSTIINNSAAWQNTSKMTEPLRFFWHEGKKRPLALLQPIGKQCWYWPADGALVDGKLYLFCMLVTRDSHSPPPFSFKVIERDLLSVDNPQSEPDKWRVSHPWAGNKAKQVQLGVSCVVDGDYLYSYGSYPPAASDLNKHPLVLARIKRTDLHSSNMAGWQYWCKKHDDKDADSGCWLSQPNDPLVLIADAAPEMTINQVTGVPGFIACYFPSGLGSDIVIRRSEKPEGPWSEPLKAYRCPEAGPGVFVYSAKVHPELASRKGQLIITYCRNTDKLEDLSRKPDIYFPQAIEVQLDCEQFKHR